MLKWDIVNNSVNYGLEKKYMSLKQECIDMFHLIFSGLPEYDDFEIEEDAGVFLCPNENYKPTDDLYYECYEKCSMKENCSKEMVKVDLSVFVSWWAGDEDGGSIYINFNQKPIKEQYKQSIYYINNRKQLIELMSQLKQRAEDMKNSYAEYAKKIIELRKYGQEFLTQLKTEYPVFSDIKADLPIVFSDFSKDENGNYEYDIGGDFKVVDAQMIIHIYDCWRDVEKLKQAVRHEILHYVLFRIGINHSDDSAYFHYFCNRYDGHAYVEMPKEQQELYYALLEAKDFDISNVLENVKKEMVLGYV